MANLNPNRSVNVVNKNIFDHTEIFRGDTIVVPKNGGTVKMIREDAVLFKSQFFQPKYDGSGVQKPESYKMISLEEIPEEMIKDLPPEATEFKCMACGTVCQSSKLLDDHVKESAGCAAQMVDEDAQKALFGD